MLRVIPSFVIASALVLTAAADMGRKPAETTPSVSLPGPELPAAPSFVAESNVDSAEISAVLDAIWQAAEVLPSKKSTRLKPNMMRLVAQSGDSALIQQWSQKLNSPMPTPQPDYVEYAANDARAAIDTYGWDGFAQRARTRQAPFNIGRPEKMAAGVRLANTPQEARTLMILMFDLAKPNVSRGGGGDTFEQSDFGHALGELSMQRCDLGMFDRAIALTAFPDSLRYAIWRARITGRDAALLQRITDDADGEDTSHVRQAIEGYSAVLARGYCTE